VDHAVSHSSAIIKAAISIYEEVLQLRPIGHQEHAEAVANLGNAMFLICYRNEPNSSRRRRCVDLLRESLRLCPPEHSSRDQVLHNLARALLFVVYEQESSDIGSLRESIVLNRAALQLRPVGHPERTHSMNNLACGLARYFEICGDLDVLLEAIAMHREVLELRPLGHPRRAYAMLNLAVGLVYSFRHQGRSEALAEAISINREAMQLLPVGHPIRWGSLSSLGLSLQLKYASTGSPELLLESICLHREAVEVVPSAHPERGPALCNLAQGLMASFRDCHDQSVLAEAITLLRESLLHPAGGDEHSERLSELAEALIASFDQQKHPDHLREAVNLHREALRARPPGHFRRVESLQKLGRLLCRSECQSWTEAISLYSEALDTCPTGSPLRAEVLSDTSRCFLDRDSPFFNLSKGTSHLAEAYSDNFCHVNRRLRSAMSDLTRVEAAYNEATTTLDQSTLGHCNKCVLDLYAQVIGLLPRAANFGLDHSTRLQAVTGLDEIARDAAARAILLRRESQALEMLEEGRGVFWAQTLRLRASAFDDVPQEDRQELQRLLNLLESNAHRFRSSDQSAIQRERDLEKRRQLNEETEALVFKIRGYVGLDRFLMPPAFDALVRDLPEGFVVIVNASKLGYHALLLHRDTRLATSLELQPPPTGFDSVTFRSPLPRDVSLATREGEIRAMRKDAGRGSSFPDVLAALWISIVQPILTQLGLQVRCDFRTYKQTLTGGTIESS
jgi:tetratricopeptide (TPR) repeat protein